jgi:hypothetical protein
LQRGHWYLTLPLRRIITPMMIKTIPMTNTVQMIPTMINIVAIDDWWTTATIAAPQRGQVLAARRSTLA